jgi:cellulose synthase/poly-beta-1,6-N-acetylglucosamine synthase-like glycosyltransferase
MNADKICAIITLSCFLFSFVCSEPLQAIVDMRAESSAAGRFNKPAGDLLIPQSCGRITDGRAFGSRQVVINIQDLHCHAEVQRNIAKILGTLDKEYGLTNVFVEGGYGDIDTSRLGNIADKALRKEVIENLISQGELTGTEYYSIATDKPHLLKGIEDEAVHKANIVRLGKILDKKEYFETKLKELDKDLEFMKARYFSSSNRIFDRLVSKNKANGIPTAKYYRLLSKYVDKINKNPDRYNNIFSISRGNYPNMQAFLEISDLAKHLRYRKLTAELRQCLQLLKAKLPYSKYNALVRKTDNFSRLDVLAQCLAQMARDHELDLAGNFPELQKFLDYTDKSGRINPIELLQEEKRLAGAIRLGLSENISELEVSFLSDFYQYFQDYLLNRITAEDYEYFAGRFDTFRSTWGKYAFKDRVADLEPDFPLLAEFYKVNCERNNISLKNIEALTTLALAAEGTAGEPVSHMSGELLKDSGIVVVVTGGFHTEGLKALFEKQKISYLTITPNVTGDTQFSSEVYTKLAKFQAGILEKDLPEPGYGPSKIQANSLALGLATQLSSKALFELAIKAVNEQLRAVKPERRKELLDRIAESTGITYRSFDEKSGTVVFDNEAQIRLEDAGGHVRAVGLKPGKVLSESVQAALDGLVRTGGFAAAAEKAILGNADDLITMAATVAAEHDLLRDNNALIYDILNDPALEQKDVINGVVTEILARFPEALQKANANYELRKEQLTSAIKKRPDWLQAVLAIDLLLGRPAAPQAATTISPKPKKAAKFGRNLSILFLSLISLAVPFKTTVRSDAGNNPDTSPFFKYVIAAWVLVSVLPFVYQTFLFPSTLAYVFGIFLALLPVRSVLLSIKMMRHQVATVEGQGISLTPKAMPSDAEWPEVTMNVPIYTESWEVIKNTLEHAVRARDRYNEKAGAEQANIVISDDGLMIFADNKIEELLKRGEAVQRGEKVKPLTRGEQEAFNRVMFAREHNIAIVARPKNKTEYWLWTFIHRGAFKKGSGMNHTLILSERIDKIMADNKGLDFKAALEEARNPDQDIAHGKPIFKKTFVSGDLHIGEFILMLDKDSIIPVNSIAATIPEFVLDPALAYTQNLTTIVNYDESFIARVLSEDMNVMWKHMIPAFAEHGFTRFYGHNGFIRTKALKAAGLWSEHIVAEDMALMMKISTLTDPVTGKPYYGKAIKYDQRSFESLLDMDKDGLDALFEEHKISKDRVKAFLADKDLLFDAIASLGVPRYFVKERWANAVSLEAREKLARAVAVYEEVTLTMGEEIPATPISYIHRLQKFSYGTAQLWLRPIREWRRHGIFTEDFRSFLSSPNTSWNKKVDNIIGFLFYFSPINIIAVMFFSLFQIFSGMSISGNIAVLIVLSVIVAENMPILVHLVQKRAHFREYKELLIRTIIFGGINNHTPMGMIRYLIGIPSIYVATPIRENRGITTIIQQTIDKLKFQFGIVALYFSLLGTGLLLHSQGILPLSDTGPWLIGIGIWSGVSALLVPFADDAILKAIRDRVDARLRSVAKIIEKIPYPSWMAPSYTASSTAGNSLVMLTPAVAGVVIVAGWYLLFSGLGAAAAAIIIVTSLGIVQINKNTGHARGSNRVNENMVGHVVMPEDLEGALEKYTQKSEFTHVFYTAVSKESRGAKTALGYKASFFRNGELKQANTFAELREGALIIYIDLRKAVKDDDVAELLRQGAAEMTAYLGGTDNVTAAKNGVAAIRKVYSRNNRAYDEGNTLNPLLTIDHTHDLTGVKHAFSVENINRRLFVSNDAFETVETGKIDPAIRKMLIKQSALSLTMGENNILKIDSGNFSEISDALDVFKASGNGQMSIDWVAVDGQLQKGNISRDEFREQLTAARNSGVLVYADYTVPAGSGVDRVKDLFDLGFQGVNLSWEALDTQAEKEAARQFVEDLKGYPVLSAKGIGSEEFPLVEVKLTEVKNMVFGPNDVIEVKFPGDRKLTMNEIRDYMQSLPLKNTIIFHSWDMAQLIRENKDIVEQKAFASLLNILLNFGQAEIATPEQARRLGFNWDISGLKLFDGEAGRRQIDALRGGSLADTGIAADSAIAEQADELALKDPELKLRKAYLNAIAEKLLMRDLVAEAFRESEAPLGEGEFPAELANPRYQDMLGSAAMKRFTMTEAERTADESAADAMETPQLGNMNSFLMERYNRMRAPQPQPGSVSIVINIILLDLIAERNLRKTNIEKGKFDTNSFKRMLAAA